MTILSRGEMIQMLDTTLASHLVDLVKHSKEHFPHSNVIDYQLEVSFLREGIWKVLEALKAEQEDDREAFEHYSALISPMYEALKAGITVVTSEGLVLTPDASPAASNTETK